MWPYILSHSPLSVLIIIYCRPPMPHIFPQYLIRQTASVILCHSANVHYALRMFHSFRSCRIHGLHNHYQIFYMISVLL